MSFKAPKIEMPETVIPTNPIEEEARRKQLANDRIDQASSVGRGTLGQNLLDESVAGGMLSRPTLGGNTVI